MSEYFTGVTFPQQKVPPSYDAIIRRAALADGILTGCDLSYSGYTLTMGAGLLIACGRQFVHTSVQNWAVSGATSGYARLVLTIDTTRASTKETFDQIVDSIEYASALDGFLELQQQDINQSGTIYQMVACVVSLGAGGITGIVEKMPPLEEIRAASKEYVDKNFRPNTWLPKPEEIGALSMELLWENASYSSEFAAQTITVDGAGDYSRYQLLLITTGGSVHSIIQNEVGRGARFVLFALTKGSQTVTYNARNISIQSGSIAFEDNIVLEPPRVTNGSVSNDATKPFRIYGINGARMAA